MSDSYTATFNQATRRMTFTFTGTWDAATAAAWDRTFRATVAQARAAGPWTLLVDLTAYPVQNETVSAMHQEHMKHSKANGMARAAVVSPKMVTAMQMKRLAGGSGAQGDIAFVSTMADGEKHLAA